MSRQNKLNPLWKPDPVPVHDKDGNYLGCRWEPIDSHNCKMEKLPEGHDLKDILQFQCSECGIYE